MHRDLITRWRVLACMALLGLGLATLGCSGGDNASVSGTVTLNGTPLNGGAITFYGAGGRAEPAWIDPTGKYSIAKAPVGEVKVTVVAAKPSEAPKLPKAREGPKHPGSAEAAAPPVGKPVVVPDKYKDPEKSGLTYTLKSGSQTIDIDLKP